jgi:hypothetical protein
MAWPSLYMAVLSLLPTSALCAENSSTLGFVIGVPFSYKVNVVCSGSQTYIKLLFISFIVT